MIRCVYSKVDFEQVYLSYFHIIRPVKKNKGPKKINNKYDIFGRTCLFAAVVELDANFVNAAGAFLYKDRTAVDENNIVVFCFSLIEYRFMKTILLYFCFFLSKKYDK
jgi:hypothetical protein